MSDQSSHTPGPWRAVQIGDGLLWIEADRSTVAVTMARPDSEANARLIAAAPDLLAACQTVVAHFGDPAGGALFGLRAAIAKAEGR